jgi:pSer/pThr/pTyr-binding forkhead associated (FHA) protein
MGAKSRHDSEERVITCPKCSKDNQDHYKFCLGCGAELPRDVAPKPFSPQTPPHGMRSAQAAAQAAAAQPSAAAAAGLAGTVAAPSAAAFPPRAAAPVAPAAAPAPAVTPAAPPAAAPPPAAAGAAPSAGPTVSCPQCGHINTPSNMFCGSCGYRLGGAAPRPPAPAPAPAPEVAASAIVLTALRADGSEGGTFQLPAGGGAVGRETGSIFAGDSYLSPRHATFRTTGAGRANVKDEGSLNGVYKKLARDVPVELRPNDVFRIGQEIIKFEPLTTQPVSTDGVERLGAPRKGYVGRIALIIGREETGNAFPIPENGVHLGRERGDILFPEDGYVSGLHCRLSWDGQKLFLTDLGSSNGTFLRVAEADVRGGDVLLMGQQLFRIGL